MINNLIIIPGPYGVKYGPGLSFIDIVATPTPRYAIPEFHSQTNVLAQSNGQQLYGREMFFGGGPDYGFRFSVGQKTGNDYRSGNNTSIPASYNVRDIDMAVGFDPGLYFELKAPIEDDLTLTTGARIDLVSSNADGTHRTIAPDGTTPKIVDLNGHEKTNYDQILGGPLNRRDVLLAAFIAADFRLTEELQLRAGFGHGERAPNATERYSYFPYMTVLQTPGNSPGGDPNLRPEKSNQFDLALIGNYDNARFQISGFASYIQDYISYATYAFPVVPPDIAYSVLHYANTNATLAGGEAAGEYDITKNWSPFFNLSYVDGRDQSRHMPLPSIYPFQSRMGLRWHDPTRKKYGVELSARIVAAQHRLASFSDGMGTSYDEPRTAGFTTFDLRGYWQFNKHLKLNGGIENFTNKNYIDALSVHNPAVYEPGTNFFLGAQLDY